MTARCPHGHEYTAANILKSHGSLACRTCRNKRLRERFAARRAVEIAAGTYVPKPRVTAEDVLARHRVTPDGCWLFTGAISTYGYATSQYEGRMVRVHRLSYEHFAGPIPDGLQIDHLCRNRACVNPAHLEPVTPRENTLRGLPFRRPKSECPGGHPYSGANLYVSPKGDKFCRECRRLVSKRLRSGVRHDPDTGLVVVSHPPR